VRKPGRESTLVSLFFDHGGREGGHLLPEAKSRKGRLALVAAAAVEERRAGWPPLRALEQQRDAEDHQTECEQITGYRPSELRKPQDVAARLIIRLATGWQSSFVGRICL